MVAAVSGCEGYQTADGQAHKKHPTTIAAHAKPRPAPELLATHATTTTRTLVAEDSSSAGPYVGLGEAQLMERLGKPSLQREDQPPGKTWRYQNRICTVDFMLYPDVETRTYRALAYEVINDDKSAAGKRLCLAELEARAHDR
ncbi:MAG TPA: hypothetical protein VLV86_03285 [Vicinamibacterales bacterium]|nr:hypothetical protein [Vicinamibacterales bacterium]